MIKPSAALWCTPGTAYVIIGHLSAATLSCFVASGCAESGTPQTPAVPTAAPPGRPVTSSPDPHAPPNAKAENGGVCENNDGCEAGLQCWKEFNGAQFLPGPGKCRPGMPSYEGRPLVVQGKAYQAIKQVSFNSSLSGTESARTPMLTPEQCEIERSHLLQAAFEEHASIAAFARTICELMALGAPAALIAKTAAALSDEVRHTQETFEWLSLVGDQATLPGPLTEAAAPLRNGSSATHELLRDVIRGGCIGESLAAHSAAERALSGPEPMRAFYQRISDDEARHAALAFDTVAWLIAYDASLRSTLALEVAAAEAVLSKDQRATLEPLLDLLRAPN